MGLDAIVLAGGHGSRLGGVSKAALLLGGVRLLDRALAAAVRAERRVVVGDKSLRVPDGVTLVREQPAFSGPAAGTVAGLRALESDGADPAEWTLVLACDLPGAAVLVTAMLQAAKDAGAAPGDGYCAQAPGGPANPLAGLYRSVALRRAAAAMPADAANRSMRALVAPLAPVGVPVAPNAAADVDTWDDYEEWRSRV